MNEPDIAASMAWAASNDPKRIVVDQNDVLFSKWIAGLEHVNANAMQINGIITDYYANAHPADNGYLPPITPQIIRKRLTDARDHKAAAQSAADMSARQLDPPKRPAGSWRARNPDEWERLVAEGKATRRDELQRHGRPLHQWQTDNKPNPAGRTL